LNESLSRPHCDPMMNQSELSQVFPTSFQQSLVLIFFCFFVALVLPRLKTGMCTILSLGFMACYSFYISPYYPFSSMGHNALIPLYVLIVGYGVVLFGRFPALRKRKENVLSGGSETDKTLGLFYQQQGMLDLAFEKFRPLVYDEAVKDILYGLGLEYEKKDQIQKALVVYKLMLGEDKFSEVLDMSIFQPEETEASGFMGEKVDHDTFLCEEKVLEMNIEGYAIISEVERPSAGVWFKAQDINTRKPVLIETVNLSQFDEDRIDDIRNRFLEDNECLRLLKHPNIVKVIDWGEDRGQVYRVREYVEGQGLDKYVKKGNLLSIREILRSVGRLADALDFAHTTGVVHQSIRPSSFIRSENGKNVKIVDFGIVWIPSVFEHRSGSLQEAHFYMSPEQIAGKKVDGRSDVFSLGIVLFEMLTGELPFTGEDMASVMISITREKHVSPRSYNPKVPRVIEQVIDRALEKDLTKRYQKAGQMASHIHMVVDRIDELFARKRSEGF